MSQRVVRVIGAAALAMLLTLSSLASLSASPVSAKSGRCTPGYSPCIPLKRTDVDCRGGSGNGPRYTRRGVVYTVKRGMDRYGLDADHDGKGCER